MSDQPSMEMMDKPPPVSAELRKKILADPNVAKIARELEMDLDEFVNTVGYYLTNPGTEPGFLVVSDENLKKHFGVTAPTNEELEENVRQTVEAMKVGQGPSGFDVRRKNTVDLPSAGGEPLNATSDPDLEETVKKARMPRKS